MKKNNVIPMLTKEQLKKVEIKSKLTFDLYEKIAKLIDQFDYGSDELYAHVEVFLPAISMVLESVSIVNNMPFDQMIKLQGDAHDLIKRLNLHKGYKNEKESN